MRTALVLLFDGFEEVEALTPIDLLSRAGIEVVQAGAIQAGPIQGRSGITVLTTTDLAELSDRSFDLIIVPGGPGIQHLRANRQICALLKQQVDKGGHIGCICAAPLLLLDSGLIDGLSYTCHPAATQELPAAVDQSVVTDGFVTTSRGAGTAIDFSLALITQLTNATTARAVAESICWQPSAEKPDHSSS